MVVAVGGRVGQIHRRPPREQVAELSGGRLHRTGPGTKTFRDFYFTAGKKNFFGVRFFIFPRKNRRVSFFLQISILEVVDKKIRNCFFSVVVEFTSKPMETRRR